MKFSSRANQIISSIFAFPWLPELLAGFAGVLYLAQSVWFAHTQWSVLDEGNYIYKGWLFVTGQYVIYQDYGPLTNHMPLAYLIFGYVQLIFGPGLRTVRYFAIFTGCLFLLGMWLVSRRLAGRWAAAACVLFLALNPFPISLYSVAITQILVGCILAWMLYFILGEDRSRKELVVGALLAGILVLVRENMILILPFLFLYIFWEHGKKTGFIFLSVCASLLLFVHILYWPGIMAAWDRWIPKALLPFFSPWAYDGGGTFVWSSQSSFSQKLLVIFISIKANFLVIFGAIAVWLSWPRGGFKNRSQFRAVLFLSVVFVAMYLAHAWASIGKDYCAFCLINYVAFFLPIGLVLFFSFLPGVEERQPILSAWVAGGLIFLLMMGIGYNSHNSFGQSLASLNIPRMSNFSFQPGTVELWQVLANKFNFSFQFVRILLPTLAGLLVGIFILVISYGVVKWARKGSLISNPVYALISVTMLMGIMLSPTFLLGGMDSQAECRQDIIASYEQIGSELAERIPLGARVYWRGDSSPTALLYVPDIKIYPPQLNAIYSFILNSDTQEALRHGYWNEELNQKWLSEADVILVRDSDFMSMSRFLSPEVFDELKSTPPAFPCAPETSIRIFKRK
jgi:hypothetical protein